MTTNSDDHMMKKQKTHDLNAWYFPIDIFNTAGSSNEKLT